MHRHNLANNNGVGGGGGESTMGITNFNLLRSRV